MRKYMILMMAAALTCGCSEEKAKESLHSVMTTACAADNS